MRTFHLKPSWYRSCAGPLEPDRHPARPAVAPRIVGDRDQFRRAALPVHHPAQHGHAAQPSWAAFGSQSRLVGHSQLQHIVSVVDLAEGKVIKEIAVVRKPSCAAVTPDEKYVVVTNFLPRGAGTDPTLSAVVSIIDTAKIEVASTVKLPAGSTTVVGACINPDGRWAYVV